MPARDYLLTDLYVIIICAIILLTEGEVNNGHCW